MYILLNGKWRKKNNFSYSSILVQECRSNGANKYCTQDQLIDMGISVTM